MKMYQLLSHPCFRVVLISLLLGACTANYLLKQSEKGLLVFGRDANSLKKIAKVLSVPDLQSVMFLEADIGNAFIEQDRITFALMPNQKKLFGGIRSELSINYPYKLGERVIYSFDMFIPNDFKVDTGKNRWWIFAQWHDQPDPKLNQTWADLLGNSPPISLFVEERNYTFGVGVYYFGKEKFWFPVDKGKWNNYTFDIIWDTDENGQLLFSLNDKKIKVFTGKNMLNNYHHYLKIGMYRHPKINILNHVSFSALEITTK